MDEKRIVELLTRKIAGEATPEELGELSYLLTKYPDSVYYEALLEQVWDMGSEEEDSNLQEVFNHHRKKFRDELNFETKRSITEFMKKPAVFISAFVTLLISAGFLFNYYTPSAQAETIQIIAGRGIRKEIKLPDGTFVRLNSDSEISYSSKMGAEATRRVELKGEAFFNVVHDKKHPFIVSTPKVSVKVLGTEFNVKEYPGEKASETTLLKGSVELTVNDRSDQKFLLKPSEKFALVEKEMTVNGDNDKSSVLSIENILPVKLGDHEYISEVTWVENKLVFQNESFEELIPKLERWYNVKISLEDPAIRSYRYTGVFIDENIMQAMEAMQLIKPFNFKRTENEIKIY